MDLCWLLWFSQGPLLQSQWKARHSKAGGSYQKYANNNFHSMIWYSLWVLKLKFLFSEEEVVNRSSRSLSDIHPSSSPSVVQHVSAIPIQQKPVSHLITPNPKPVYTVPKVCNRFDKKRNLKKSCSIFFLKFWQTTSDRVSYQFFPLIFFSQLIIKTASRKMWWILNGWWKWKREKRALLPWDRFFTAISF